MSNQNQTTIDQNIASRRGEFFELAFNIGVMAAIVTGIGETHEIVSKYKEAYSGWYNGKLLDIGSMIAGYITASGDTTPVDVIRANFMEAACRGIDFTRTLIAAAGQHGLFEAEKDDNLELVYLQVGLYQFYNKLEDPQHREIQKRLLKEQMRDAGFSSACDDTYYLNDCREKGEFFNADTIVLLRKEGARNSYRYYLGVFDASAFTADKFMSVNSPKDAYDELRYVSYDKRSQSMFRSTEAKGDCEYNGTAVNRAFATATDKSLNKAVQASAYASSFIDFLTKEGILTIKRGKYTNLELVSCIGITNGDHSTICMQRPKAEAIDTLRTMKSVYCSLSESDIDGRMKEAANKLLLVVDNHFTREPDEEDWKVYSKILDGFVSEDIPLKNRHKEMLAESIKDQSLNIIRACGAPGIGKTTSIKSFVQDADATFLFYSVPRTAILADFTEKIAGIPGAVAITTDGSMAEKTVDLRGYPATIESIKKRFPDWDFSGCRDTDNFSGKNFETQQRSGTTGYLRQKKSDVTIMQKLAGVVRMILDAEAKGEIEPISKLAVSATTQAVSKCGNFESGINTMLGINMDTDETKKESEKRLKAFSNFLFVIDEVSGDDGGIKAANGLKNTAENIKSIVPEANVKYIMADASVQDEKAISIYEAGNTGECIFINRYDGDRSGLTNEPVESDYESSTVINCCCYPAKDIHVIYKLAEGQNRNADTNAKIVADIMEWRKTRRTLQSESGQRKEQYILFLQGKAQLAAIETLLDTEGVTSIKITAETDKTNIDKQVNAGSDEAPEVILMTSSGARGVSFKYVTTIACYVPTFNTATNQMEIAQAIYRGRGDSIFDSTLTKNLVFYIDLSSDRNRDRLANTGNVLSVTERMLREKLERRRRMQAEIDAVTMMLLTNAGIETRIYGKDSITGYTITPLGRQTESCSTEILVDTIAAKINKIGRRGSHIDKLKKLIQPKNGYVTNIDHKTEIDNLYENIQEALAGICEHGEPQQDILPFTISNGCIVFKTRAQFNQVQDNPRAIEYKLLLDDNFYKKCMQEADTKECRKNIIDLFKYAKENAEYFDTAYLLTEKDTSTGYIAFPLGAFHKEWSHSLWKELNEEVGDGDTAGFVGLMYTMFRSEYDIGARVPYDDTHRFEDTPYLFFKSADFEEKQIGRVRTTRLITSNHTNMLSLIFSAEEIPKA